MFLRLWDMIFDWAISVFQVSVGFIGSVICFAFVGHEVLEKSMKVILDLLVQSW